VGYIILGALSLTLILLIFGSLFLLRKVQNTKYIKWKKSYMEQRLKQIENSKPIGFRNTMKEQNEFNELKDVAELHPDKVKVDVNVADHRQTMF